MTPQKTENATQPQPAITAQSVLGLPEGAHVIIRRTMPELMFEVIGAAAPDVASGMQVIDGQTAVVVTANAELLELHLDNAITLPAASDRPAVVSENTIARLRILQDGTFEFSTSGTSLNPQVPKLAYVANGLTAERELDAIVFSANGMQQLRATPSAGPGSPANFSAFSAPYLSHVPAFIRAFAPRLTALVSVTQI